MIFANWTVWFDGLECRFGVLAWLPTPADTGQISVFLSSPFKGLEEERNLFKRKELPRLFRKCDLRGVHLRYLMFLSQKITQNGQFLAVWIRLATEWATADRSSCPEWRLVLVYRRPRAQF